MREKNTVNFAERRDGDAIQDVVTVVEQNFGDADERSVEFTTAEQFGEFDRRGKNDLVFNAWTQFTRVCVPFDAGRNEPAAVRSNWR